MQIAYSYGLGFFSMLWPSFDSHCLVFFNFMSELSDQFLLGKVNLWKSEHSEKQGNFLRNVCVCIFVPAFPLRSPPPLQVNISAQWYVEEVDKQWVHLDVVLKTLGSIDVMLHWWRLLRKNRLIHNCLNIHLCAYRLLYVVYMHICSMTQIWSGNLPKRNVGVTFLTCVEQLMSWGGGGKQYACPSLLPSLQFSKPFLFIHT